MRSLRLPAALLAAAALAGCTVESADCTPTKTTARRAGKVDLRAAGRSATLQATLTAAGEPVDGAEIAFVVLADGAAVYDADGVTGADGVARVDLKRADPEALVALARADEFRASFRGDGRYCSSRDDAPVGVVGT